MNWNQITELLRLVWIDRVAVAHLLAELAIPR